MPLPLEETDLVRPDSYAGRELVERLDRDGPASARARSGAELHIGLLLLPTFPLLSLAGFCDALRHAADLGDQSRPLRCAWTLLGTQAGEVHASCNASVRVEGIDQHPEKFDYLVVIGGLLSHLDGIDRRLWDYLAAKDAQHVPLIGMCTGSFVLALGGYMKDRVACVHAYHYEDYKRMFPGLGVMTNADYLLDGNRITCAGGVSVIELATRLIGLHCGADRAAKVIHQMTVSRRGGASFIERRQALGYPSVDNVQARHAIVLMEENLEAPLTIETIAKMTGTSVRQLERVFVGSLGVSPKNFYRTMRLRYARWLLLNSARPLNDIAYGCGFADLAHFIRSFRTVYGMTPGKLRASGKESA
ncbi:helix-turn-helix domain-containing protein [Robbsia sp. KACC 23696]|uniref:GlxA family transcriptional regulator n=1 Tax=Robbsia sp. KACC 23696 TaxID=3149231 RepID=UPI00325ABE2F